MTCAAVQKRLLSSENPVRLGAEDACHLRACHACKAMHQRVVTLEADLRRLPVPSVSPPPRLLRQILSEPVRPGEPIPLVRPALPGTDQRRVREGGRQKLALAFSLAATLALFSLARWAWPSVDEPPATSRAVASAYERSRENWLRNSRTPAQRVDVLANWAADLLDQVRAEADHPQKVAELVRDFERVVQEDLMHHALMVPPADRERVLLAVSQSLGRTESTASRLAAEWEARQHPSAGEVRRLAMTVREADGRLRRLAQNRA